MPDDVLVEMTLYLRVPTVENIQLMNFFVSRKSGNREKEARKCVGEQQR